jgi:hypothetical protein
MTAHIAQIAPHINWAALAFDADDPKRWITVNGARIPLNKEGEPTGKVGEKLQDPEKNSGRSRNSAPVAKLEGSELGVKSGESVKEAAIRYYAELKKSPANREGFGKVEFTRKGQDKLNSSALSDSEKLKLLPAVKNIIEHGDYIGRTDGKGSVVAYHYFEGNVTIGGVKKFVGVTVGEDNRGNKFYNLNENPDVLLVKKKARELAQNSAGGRGPSGDSVPEVLNIRIVPACLSVKRQRLLTGIKSLLAARGLTHDGNRWITVKPNGPDATGRPALIAQIAPHINWAALVFDAGNKDQKRGQPGNAGQFASKEAGGASGGEEAIFAQYRHNAKGAIEALKKAGGGVAVAALHHPEIGDIDLRWGKTSDDSRAKGEGLAKIIKWHPEVMNNLQGFISKLKVRQRDKKQGVIRLGSGKGGRAAIRIDYNGKSGNWLLTAYMKKASVSKGSSAALDKVSGRDPATPDNADNLIVGFDAWIVKQKNDRRHRLITGIEALLAHDAHPRRHIAQNNRLAFDRATVRRIDANGFLHVDLCHISKECVNPYHGEEIPGWKKHSLDPDKVYYGYRAGAELTKAAATFNGLPLLRDHYAESAENPQKEHRVGSMGTDAVFAAPYLNNSLTVTDAEAIHDIESGFARELSASYQYDPVFTPGTFAGKHYDFIMTNIRGNHVALVEEGRAGPDVLVADRQIERNKKNGRKFSMGLKELLAKLKELIASAGKADTAADPDATTKEKMPLGDADPPPDKETGGDEPADIGAQVFALIDQIDDKELAEKIKAKIKEAGGESDDKSASGKPDAAATDDDDDSPDEIDEILEKLEAMLRGGGEANSDDDPDSGAADATDPLPDDDENKTKGKGAGMPEKNEEKKDMATDAAIERRVNRLAMDIKTVKEQAQTMAQRHFRTLYDAARKVRPLIGEVDPLAFDSASGIYKFALKQAGRSVGTNDQRALGEMIDIMIETKQAAIPAVNCAMPAGELDGPFSGLKNVTISL